MSHNLKQKRGARPKLERAALKLFVDTGFDAATTRQIASEAGVSEGALYRHYKGKDELALTLFMETHNRLGQMLADALSKPGTVEQRISRAIEAYCRLADEDWLLFSFHLVSMNRFLPHDSRREDDPLTRFERVFSTMMEDGLIPRSDPALTTAMCLGVVTQAAQNKIYNRLPGPFSNHAGEFSRAIIAILFKK